MPFKCYKCGETFDEPATRSERIGEFWGTPAYMDFNICPYCHSDDVEEISEDEIFEEDE